MKRMLRKYRTEYDISILWDEFRNDKLFDFDKISGLKKVNSDNFEFSFSCRRNKFSVFSYPEFKGTVQSSMGKGSYITVKPFMRGTRTATFLYFLVLYILGLLLRHNIYFISIFVLSFIGVICIDRYFYNMVLRKDLYILEDRYKLELILDPNI